MILAVLVSCALAQRAVLFDRADLQRVSLLTPSAGPSRSNAYFEPAGTLTFKNGSVPSIRTTRVSTNGRFNGVTASITGIGRLPVTNDTLAIDVDYTFSLYDTLRESTMVGGHGSNQLFLLSSDEDMPDEPRGLALEYGGGSFGGPDATNANWSESRVQAWRFGTVQTPGIFNAVTRAHVTVARGIVIRSGLFRLRIRFLLHQNQSSGAILESQQFAISVQNNVNFTGDLLVGQMRLPNLPWYFANASRWLARNAQEPPRLMAFSTRTDFDMHELVITAEPLASAPSFNSSWLTRPPTALAETSAAAQPTSTSTATSTRVPSSVSPDSTTAAGADAHLSTTATLLVTNLTTAATEQGTNASSQAPAGSTASELSGVVVITLAAGLPVLIFCFGICILLGRDRQRRARDTAVALDALPPPQSREGICEQSDAPGGIGERTSAPGGIYDVVPVLPGALYDRVLDSDFLPSSIYTAPPAAAMSGQCTVHVYARIDNASPYESPTSVLQ